MEEQDTRVLCVPGVIYRYDYASLLITDISIALIILIRACHLDLVTDIVSRKIRTNTILMQH